MSPSNRPPILTPITPKQGLQVPPDLRRRLEVANKTYQNPTLLDSHDANTSLVTDIYSSLDDQIQASEPIFHLIRSAVERCFAEGVHPNRALNFFSSDTMLDYLLAQEQKTNRIRTLGEEGTDEIRFLTGEHIELVNRQLDCFDAEYNPVDKDHSISNFLSTLATHERFSHIDIYRWFGLPETIDRFKQLLRDRLHDIILDLYKTQAKGHKSLEMAQKFIDICQSSYLRYSPTGAVTLDLGALFAFYQKHVKGLASDKIGIDELDDAVLAGSLDLLPRNAREIHINNLPGNDDQAAREVQSTLESILKPLGLNYELKRNSVLVEGYPEEIANCLEEIYDVFASREGEFMGTIKVMARPERQRPPIEARKFYNRIVRNGQIDTARYHYEIRQSLPEIVNDDQEAIENERLRWEKVFREINSYISQMLSGAEVDSDFIDQTVLETNDYAQLVQLLVETEDPRQRTIARLKFEMGRLLNKCQQDPRIAYREVDADAIQNKLERVNGLAIDKNNPNLIFFFDYPDAHPDHLKIVQDRYSEVNRQNVQYVNNFHLVPASITLPGGRKISFYMSCEARGQTRNRVTTITQKVVHVKSMESIFFKHLRDALNGQAGEPIYDLYRSTIIADEEDIPHIQEYFQILGGFGQGLKYKDRVSWKNQINEASGSDYRDTTLITGFDIHDAKYGDDNQRFRVAGEIKLVNGIASFAAQKSKYRQPGHRAFRTKQFRKMVQQCFPPSAFPELYRDANEANKDYVFYQPKLELVRNKPKI